MNIKDIDIGKIGLGNRHRREFGDIDALAENIKECGLLQPICVDEELNLICGERRLLAFRYLDRKTIPAHVLKLDSLLAGEYAENEFRKQFTASERAAIGKAMEAELGNRHGGDRKSTAANAALEKGKTADIAAKRAGFKSAETFERAKKVTEKGSPELIAAMDEGKVSIAAAATIASQPQTDQRKIVELPKQKQQAAIAQIRKTKADREANEQRARDLRLFAGLDEAVEFIARFYEPPKETWAGLSRVSAFDFASNLKLAIQCLTRLDKEHPNELRKPEIAARRTP